MQIRTKPVYHKMEGNCEHVGKAAADSGPPLTNVPYQAL
jgi:hypothetical protein